MSRLSGFPELLPSQRLVEQRVLDHLRRVFELHGFGSIETRAVEPMDVLLRKGDIDKEVYVLRRLHAPDADGPEGHGGAAGADGGLGLHYDLTVPFARYVLEHAHALDFPFRRYQIQKVWRGERPQQGRFREFTQADIDVVGRDTLPFHVDVEVAQVMAEAMSGLPVPPLRLQISNRRVLDGFYRGLGIDDPTVVLPIVDKLDKLPPEAVAAQLRELGLGDEQTAACLALADIRSEDLSFVERVRGLGVEHETLETGLAELAEVVDGVRGVDGVTPMADLRIARGLDYYTGTVFETRMAGYEHLGSICSGGRYEQLAADHRNTYPGVGISLGVSRLLVPLLADGLDAGRSVPTVVLVALNDEDDRAAAGDVARTLRSRGVATEVVPAARRFGQQIKHAERRGIPYVWFPSPGPGQPHQVKDIRSGEQVDADPDGWSPPAADIVPSIRSPHQGPGGGTDHETDGAKETTP